MIISTSNLPLFPQHNIRGLIAKKNTFKAVRPIVCVPPCPHSLIESKEWDPKAKNPDAVYRALAASGLNKIVYEYLRITVYCCLQKPAVTFTDDLGNVERYNTEVHATPIDGEQPGEWCVVVFPALMVATGGEDWGAGPEVVGKRFVLTSKGV